MHKVGGQFHAGGFKSAWLNISLKAVIYTVRKAQQCIFELCEIALTLFHNQKTTNKVI